MFTTNNGKIRNEAKEPAIASSPSSTLENRNHASMFDHCFGCVHSKRATSVRVHVPRSALIFDGTGSLYGTTEGGGADGKGAVFKLTRAAVSGGGWTEKVIYSFKGPLYDGQNPWGRLAFDATGHLYGTTYVGGQFGRGRFSGSHLRARSAEPGAKLSSTTSPEVLTGRTPMRD